MRQIVSIYEASWGPRHPVTAIQLNNLAGDLQNQGKYAEAEALFRRALSINEARLGPDHPNTAGNANNLGWNLHNQGRYGDAERLYRRALSSFEASLNVAPYDVAGTLNNLATSLDSQGRYADAEPLHRRALAIFEASPGLRGAPLAGSLDSLAENLNRQGRYVEAEAYYRQALIALQSGYLDQGYMATLLYHLAINLIYQGHYADAEPLSRRALEIREAHRGADHPDTAESLSAVGLVLNGQGRYAEAEPILRRALSIFEARVGADHRETAASAENLAVVELKLSHFEAALAHARAAHRARENLRTGANLASAEGTRTKLESASGNSATLFLRAAWSLGREQAAQGPALRAEAFEASQAVRASSAADALAQGAARLAAERAGAGQAVVAWRAAQDRITAIDTQIAQAAGQGATGDARRAALSAERAGIVEQLASAERYLAMRFPRYFELLMAVPVSVSDLQATSGDKARMLRDDEALVVLTPGSASWMPEHQRRGLVFVVTKETSAWGEIPLEPEALAAEIAALHAMLADADAGATLAAGKPAPAAMYDRTRAFALYRALFGAPEIAAALAGKSRWLIAPQGPLMSLPFAALPMAAPPGGAAADADPPALRLTAWLGTEHTLAILPSVSALRVQRLYPLERAQGQRTPFFGVGDPAFKGVADSDVRGGQLGAARSYFRGGVADLSTFALLPRLPNTAREIRTLAQNLGAGPDSYVLQLDASEAELRRRNTDGRLGRAEIIAFATHGLVAGEFQNSIAEPALALTPPVLAPGSMLSPDNDGLLTASEAATLNLSARFVILSACNTASGGRPDAEALSGLARAFFYAGAQSLLVSHYPVGDAAAMRLTTEAARLARMQTLRNPEAMRASMQGLLQDTSADANGRSFSHPAAWAPFAVIDAN